MNSNDNQIRAQTVRDSNEVQIVYGDIFASHCQAITNPVNTLGVSGKGLALEFKKRYPRCCEIYTHACKRELLKTGEVLAIKTQDKQEFPPEWIVFFPTKEHWRNPSSLAWIKEGLIDLYKFAQENNVTSIALPALGCGLGGLVWEDVLSCIKDVFDGSRIFVEVYAPRP